MSSSSLRMCFIRCILTITLLGLLVACDDEPEGDLKRDAVSLEILPGNTDGTATDVELLLSWLPNPDEIFGYIVYYGPAADATVAVASVLSVTDDDFDPQAPSVRYNARLDLNFDEGSNVCFRLRAYNNVGESDFSGAACRAI